MSTPFDFSALRSQLAARPALAPLLQSVPDDFARHVRHGDFARWAAALEALPALHAASVELRDRLRIGEAQQLDDTQRAALRAALMELHPWRKGPLEWFGLVIDTEWRSDWKWNRVAPALDDLTGRAVLDVGCGNGYHCWRLAGAGAAFVLGIDPHLLYNLQYWAVRRYVPEVPVHQLPLVLEDMPPDLQGFDTVLSMGVLYHRRSPSEHLRDLRGCLRPGGQLVLETLVVTAGEGLSLSPPQRYARMPNVWFVPTCSTLAQWLVDSGYTDIRLVDVSMTTRDEQRSTPWMRFESLAEALDPQHPGITVEGLPAPCRAIFVARR